MLPHKSSNLLGLDTCPLEDHGDQGALRNLDVGKKETTRNNLYTSRNPSANPRSIRFDGPSSGTSLAQKKLGAV